MTDPVAPWSSALAHGVGLSVARDEDEPPDDDFAADDLDDAYVGRLEYAQAVSEEVETLRRRRDAQRRLKAEEAPPLRVLGCAEFLNAPVPEPLVDGLLYRDSLSRIYGKPGSGKSFVALDLALRVALGQRWTDRDVKAGPVVYVMAEGQRVNTERARAWLDRNATDPTGLEQQLYVVPDAVMLTEDAVAPFAKFVGSIGASLVILDTKNAMMVGEESSATDFAVLRRAMDMIRKASDACVVLVDHTGHENTARARGSSAGTAAMDTEVSVESDGNRPQRITVKVTRDKAAEDGLTRAFHLRMHDPAAVLVADDRNAQSPTRRNDDAEWRDPAGVVLPTEVVSYEGPGAKLVPDLAQVMAHDAAPHRGDPDGVGVTRAEATKSLKAAGLVAGDPRTVHRAWSVLRALKVIEPVGRTTSATGRHVWTAS